MYSDLWVGSLHVSQRGPVFLFKARSIYSETSVLSSRLGVEVQWKKGNKKNISLVLLGVTSAL
jgi:hypothetical protein